MSEIKLMYTQNWIEMHLEQCPSTRLSKSFFQNEVCTSYLCINTVHKIHSYTVPYCATREIILLSPAAERDRIKLSPAERAERDRIESP